MTLRAGHYRAIQLFYDDGSPVLGPGNREVFVTRCGAELLGTRTDGGDATKNIATFLGIRRKTVAPSGPLTPVTVPGGVGTPGSGFEPGQGQIQGDGGGGLLTVGGGKLIVPEDKEVWVVKPCTRTPGPPAGPFPLGNHVATPLGVQHDDGSGAKAVYADGCVECAAPRRYRCDVVTCVEDPQGAYGSLEECQQYCTRPPQFLCGFPNYPVPANWLLNLGEHNCARFPPPAGCNTTRGYQVLEVREYTQANECLWSSRPLGTSLTLLVRGSFLIVRSDGGFGLPDQYLTEWSTNSFTGFGLHVLPRTRTAPACPNAPATITVEPM